MHFAQLHCHTKYSNSRVFESLSTPEQFLKIAKRRGLSAIAITDHNTMEGSIGAQKLAGLYGITVIPAVEVDTDGKGQILAYGVRSNITPKRSTVDIINDVHNQGGVAIIPHPFDVLHAMENLDEVTKYADGIEILNLGTIWNTKAIKYAQSKNIKVRTAGADAHTHFLVDSVVLGFSEDCVTAEDYVNAIRSNEFKIVRRKPRVLALLIGGINLIVANIVGILTRK
jgi:predicted metal-dependent phosphoesterase TrpH